MTDRDYIAWSLLVAGAFALALVAAQRLGADNLQPLFVRRRARLVARHDDQVAQRNRMEAGKLDDAIARLDAFAARHVRVARTLVALDRLNLVVGTLVVGFVGVDLWTDRVGNRGQWPAMIVWIPFFVVGGIIESIPPVDGEARGRLILAAMLAAFAVPLGLGIWTAPR